MGNQARTVDRGLKIGRIAGVEVVIDWSLIIIFALITFNLAGYTFPSRHPEWSPLLNWATAIGAALLFFASVLAHELSHAVVAKKYDIPVDRITLFLFGGIAHLRGEPSSPKAEFWMAIVGPLTSLAIGVVATFLGLALAGGTFDFGRPMELFDRLSPLSTLLLWLGPINIVLAIFNLVPGFPLDGGRVLRSILWATSKDLVKATRWASRAGQIFAWFLMSVGAVNVLTGNLGGLWLLLIGWFLNNAARASYAQLIQRRAFEEVPVSQVMRSNLESVPPELPIDVFVRERLMRSSQHAFPVMQDGRLLGMVTFDDVRKLPASAWAVTPVSRIMTPVDALAALPADASAERALTELASKNVDELPVLDDGQLVGLVGKSDLVKWMALQEPAH